MKLPEKKEIALDLYHRLSTDTENTDLFDKVVDLSYENEQLRSKIQVSQDKLEKAYEFMKHAGCVPGANWRSEGVGAQDSCRNGSVRDAPSGRDTALGVLLVDN